LFAQGLSSLGTSISTVALAVMIFDRTGSVFHMGGILASATLPLVVMSFVGGALLDRFEARRLMVIADVGRALLILSLPLVLGLSVGFVYLVSASIGILASIFNPSQVKLVGEVVRREDLIKSNSYLSIARDGSELAGYLIGGALVVTVGYFATFALDAATYLGSALLLFGLPRVLPVGPAPRLWSLVRQSPRALGVIWSRPELRTNFLISLVPMSVLMMATPNAYALALDVYDVGARGFSIMEVITSLGWLAGGVLASRINYSGDRNTYVFVSMLGMAVCLGLVGLAQSFPLAVGLLAVGAVANVGMIVGSMTLFQEIEARPDKGRVIAIRSGFGQLASAAGLFMGGALGTLLGVERVFTLMGLVAGVLAIAVYAPYRLRDVRRVVGQVPVVAPDAEDGA